MLPIQWALICSIFLTLSRQMYMGNINLSRNLIMGQSKSTSLCKIAFLTPVHLRHLLKTDKLLHDTEKCFLLSTYDSLSISHIKGCRNQIMSKDVEKLRNSRYNLCVHSRFHIDPQVLTSHFREIVELWCFGCDSAAISEAHGTFWIFFIVAHCNIIRTY